QYVNAEVFLQTDGPLGLFRDELIVFRLGDCTFFQVSSPFAYVAGLGERANGGGGKCRQIEFGLLLGFTIGKRTGTLGVVVGNVRPAGLHLVAVDEGRRAAALLRSLVGLEAGCSRAVRIARG